MASKADPSIVWQGWMRFMEGGRSWQETWFSTKYTSSQDALLSLGRLSRVRAGGLGYSAHIVEVRVSRVDIRGDSNVAWNLALPAPDTKEAENAADMASSAWQVRVESGSGVRRSMWLRGMPEAWWSNPQGFSPDNVPPPPALTNWLVELDLALSKEGWGLYGIDPSASTQEQDILTLGQDQATGRVQLTAAAGATLPNFNDMIRLYRLGRLLMALLKGPQRVFSVAAPTITLYTVTPINPGTVYGGQGVFRNIYRKVTPVTRMYAQYVSTRKTGSDTFLGTGRSRRRRV